VDDDPPKEGDFPPFVWRTIGGASFVVLLSMLVQYLVAPGPAWGAIESMGLVAGGAIVLRVAVRWKLGRYD